MRNDKLSAWNCAAKSGCLILQLGIVGSVLIPVTTHSWWTPPSRVPLHGRGLQPAILITDADPEAAAIRKPEYPLEFLRQNRDAYLKLSAVVGMTIVPPSSLNDASQFIQRIFTERCVHKEVRRESSRVPCSAPSGPAKAV